MQQLESGRIEEVTRLETRDGFAAQGTVQPASRTGSGVCWEPGKEVAVEEALPRDQGSGPRQRGATQRRQEVEALRASRENTEPCFMSGASTYPQSPSSPAARDGAGVAQHDSLSPTLDEAALCSHPKRRSLTSPAGDVTGAVIVGGEGRVWAGRRSRAALLRWPLGKHSGWARTPGSCLQIRLGQPGCYYC